MLRNSAAIRPAIADDDKTAHAGDTPAEWICGNQRQPLLAIHVADEVLQVHQHGLQLDDEQRAGSLMPSKNVDNASFAEV